MDGLLLQFELVVANPQGPNNYGHHSWVEGQTGAFWISGSGL